MSVDTLNALADHAEAYAEAGLYVLPLKPGGKEPLTANGLKDASNDTATVSTWWQQWPDANIGIACEASGLVVVDIDRHDADGFATFRALEQERGVMPDGPIQATGGNGQHRIFRARPGAQYPGRLGPGVDVKHKGYIVAAPSIHPSGTPYRWVRTLRHVADIPEAPAWIERRPPQNGGTQSDTPLPTGLDMGEVQDALRSIPADDRDIWLQVGMALHSTGHPAARGAWDAWSATSQKYDPPVQEKTWRSFKGDGTTIATVFALAQRHGWTNPKATTARVLRSAVPVMEDIPVEAYEDVPAPTTKPAPEKPQWRASLVSAADIVPVSVRWLWPGWLASGKLTVLAGAGGAGKTTLALGLIATLTSGGRWPDGTPCLKPRNAIIWSSEDDPADTLVPRLMAAGANLHRVHFVKAITNEQGERQPFDPATDMDLLRAEAARVGDVGLLLLDPLVSAVKGDMHRANDVRRSLQAVVDFAEENDCAVLGISHFAKGGAGSTPSERVIGSQAFSALARTVLVAAKQEEGETRVLARAKSNISVDEGGVSYTIEETTVEYEGSPIAATRPLWGGTLEGTARDILGAVEEPEDPEEDQDNPVDALRRILRDGPMDSREVKAAMKRNGYTEKQIRTARSKLQVVIVRSGTGRDMNSTWSLPDVV